MIDGVGMDGTGRVVAPRARAGTAGQPRFAVGEPAGGAARTATAGAAATVTLDGILALQEQAGEAERDRAARRHGQALLAALATLQRTLLADADQAETITHLATLAGAVPAAADPALAATIRAILLRTRVEMARRGA